MKRLLSLLLVLATATHAVAVVAADAATLDVLDVPATRSALASRTLLNGLARAGDRVIAVGQRGHVLYSDDAGATWQQAEVPVSSDLVAVSFPSASTGWAVGHDGVILHTNDSGATWSRQLDGRRAGVLLLEAYPEVASAKDAERAAALHDQARHFAEQNAENPFLDVWFADENEGYAVGAFGLILHTTDAGVTWQPWLHEVDNPGGLHLYAIRSAGGEIYIVGEQGLVLRLDHKTGQFERLELPYKGTLFGVIGDTRSVVVFGLRGTVLRSVDRGASWQLIATGLQVGMTGGTVGADGRFVIVSQAGHVLASDDAGATFALQPVQQPLPAAAVVVAEGGALVVAGPRGARALAPAAH
ncbi:MAG TPA: YCF48-related protein [Rudaea sp.]|nr:YCF48-related protein [Rudaea sp.]